MPDTTSGPVSGLSVEGAQEFRGIPFAGPIGGARRFRAAVPPEPWTAPRRATAWPLMAPQPWGMSDEDTRYFGDVFGEPYVTTSTEDGLYLNLWTPAADDARRPVLVWLHGGGFWFGQPTRPRENGRRLSAAEDVVVVAPSHRLGLLGYLDTRELFGGDANVGMTDIVLALRWVRDNIAAFGGDPGNVTLFGESGGGMKIAALMAMPGAAGLFHRAICQSGVMPLPGAPGGLGGDQAGEILAEVLATVGDKRALLETPAAELARLPVPALGWQPILDDETLPVPVPEALAAGVSATTPLMAGSNAAEMRVLTRGPDLPATLEELTARLGGAGDMARHYVEHGGDFASAAEQALTDHVFRHPTIRFAEMRAAAGGAPVYVYLLRWHNPARPDVGAGHGVETSLVFGNLDAVPALRDEPSAAAMGAAMRAAWASFARTGVPMAAGESWPAFTVDGRATLIWDLPPVVVSDPPPLF